jgi:hypothetical protein
MMTDAPTRALALSTFVPGKTGVPPMGIFERCVRALHCAMCSLHGHDSVLQYEGSRMFLQCTSCGSETPGWDVSPSPAVSRRRVAPRPVPRGAGGLTVVRKIA